MLRKEYLAKFKESNPLTLDLDRQKREDDNYLIDSNRPIKEQDIQKLPKEKLQKFVDKVLLNGKVNNVLFSSNASSEIKILKNTHYSLHNKKINLKKREPPQYNVGKMRENREIIAQAQAVGDQQLEEEYHIHLENIGKVKRLHETISNSKKIQENPYDYSEKYKKKRIKKIFEGIKERMNTISLPEVKLNLNNVYSRLYHNVVYLNTNSSINSEGNDTDHKTIKKTQIQTPKYDFKVKNVFESSTGKEFTLKVTDELLMKCFAKHSGGPKLKVHNVSSVSLCIIISKINLKGIN